MCFHLLFLLSKLSCEPSKPQKIKKKGMKPVNHQEISYMQIEWQFWTMTSFRTNGSNIRNYWSLGSTSWKGVCHSVLDRGWPEPNGTFTIRGLEFQLMSSSCLKSQGCIRPRLGIRSIVWTSEASLLGNHTGTSYMSLEIYILNKTVRVFRFSQG